MFPWLFLQVSPSVIKDGWGRRQYTLPIINWKQLCPFWSKVSMQCVLITLLSSRCYNIFIINKFFGCQTLGGVTFHGCCFCCWTATYVGSRATLLLCHLGPTHVWNTYTIVLSEMIIYTRERCRPASSTKKAMLFFLMEKKSLFPFFRSEKRWQAGFFKSPNCANEMDRYLHFAHCAGFFCTI